MKNIRLKPLDQKVIQVYGHEDPILGLKWANDAKVFFEENPRGTQLIGQEIMDRTDELFPQWNEGRNKPLTLGQVVGRLNLGGGNKSFGEPRLQLFYDARSRSYLVIDAVELIDQINVAESMANAGHRAHSKLEYALKIATSQMKLELSEEQQQGMLQSYAVETQGVALAQKWADPNVRSLKDAARTVLGLADGNGEHEQNGGESGKRNKK